jgi:hypothetical protein
LPLSQSNQREETNKICCMHVCMADRRPPFYVLERSLLYSTACRCFYTHAYACKNQSSRMMILYPTFRQTSKQNNTQNKKQNTQTQAKHSIHTYIQPVLLLQLLLTPGMQRKQSQTKRNETKRNETKRNETKRKRGEAKIKAPYPYHTIPYHTIPYYTIQYTQLNRKISSSSYPILSSPPLPTGITNKQTKQRVTLNEEII